MTRPPASGLDRPPADLWDRAATMAFGRTRTYPSSGRAMAILLGAMLTIASIVTGAVLISQELVTTTAVADPDVIFAQGTDYAAINSAGFATLALGGNATSGTLTLTGVPGAASVVLGDVMKIINQDASQAYDVTIIRGSAPPGAVAQMTFLVQTAADATVVSYDAATAGSSSTFSLPASTTYDVTVTLAIDDGTLPGTLGSTTFSFDLEPA